MDTDDLEPVSLTADIKNLEVMSVEALEEYIEQLEAEIARARAAIAHKQTARSAADAFFK